jgi:hypothetical protein
LCFLKVPVKGPEPGTYGGYPRVVRVQVASPFMEEPRLLELALQVADHPQNSIYLRIVFIQLKCSLNWRTAAI